MTESRVHREAVHGLFFWTCSALILAAAVLMLVQIGKKPFWVDESIAVLPARSIHTDLLPRNPFDLDFMPWQLEDDIWDPLRHSIATEWRPSRRCSASRRRRRGRSPSDGSGDRPRASTG